MFINWIRSLTLRTSRQLFHKLALGSGSIFVFIRRPSRKRVRRDSSSMRATLIHPGAWLEAPSRVKTSGRGFVLNDANGEFFDTASDSVSPGLIVRCTS
jgi:hypothetical protein